MTFNLPEKWIWLDSARFPNSQTTVYSGFSEEKELFGNYSVAEFKKEYNFKKQITSCTLRFSADTEFLLYLNGKVVASGPVCVGGDFLYNDAPRPSHYASEITLSPNTDTLSFLARVKLMPVGINEYSKGRGGFMLGGSLEFSDETERIIFTDSTWQCRLCPAFTAPYKYDGRLKPTEFDRASEIVNIWNTKLSPLPQRTESIIKPENGVIKLKPFEHKTVIAEFKKIYSGYVNLSVKCRGELKVILNCFETTENGSQEEFIFDSDCEYRGLQLHSAGAFKITAENNSDCEAEIDAALVYTHYPVYGCEHTVTSDSDLNDVLETCAHTLKICRQTVHLDSPRHSEPLACTGDYYIETLMTAFSYGDMTLSEFDILRTAELLREHDGEMFHTSYSLIWVLMLYDTYMLTGNINLLKECEDALLLLLNRFNTYLGDNGLIETPPNYMFIDWIYIDEISLHHPPKALGQTCLSMFYYGALKTAAKIFARLNKAGAKDDCIRRAESIKAAVNTYLFDSEKGLYFEGLNTPTPEKLLYNYMPQNTEKRYYRVHANILAAYFGICDKERAKELINRVLTDSALGDCQPYFKHYLLEAIYRNGMRDEYTLKVSERWKAPVKECKKGLVEGFIVPEPSYSFDHSHAWGGTPLYSLPKALTGIELIEPGYKKISLSPSLLGLDEAEVNIPTPFGKISVHQKQGEAPEKTVPKEIAVESV